MISVVMAAILLIGAIISLYFCELQELLQARIELIFNTVHNPHVRLGLLAFWTVLFSLSVSILSTAKRSEVFASTAAYAAVLVVFVSGDLANMKI